MLNKQILNDDTAFWHMEMMAWLISEFGPPLTPPVPSLLHRALPLHARAWDDSDQRSVFSWAEDEFANLKSECQMTEFETSLISNSTDVRVSGAPSPMSDLNTTPVEFDPRRCTEPGHFGIHALIKLAELKSNSRPRPDAVRPDDYSALTILTIAYLGQGLNLAAAPRELLEENTSAGKMTRGEYGNLVNTIAFTGALAMACRRMQPETAILNYGPIMTKQFSKKLSASFRQIDRFADEIKILKIMTSKGRDASVYVLGQDAQIA